MARADTSPANIARILRQAAFMIDAKAGGIRKGFTELNFAENELRVLAAALEDGPASLKDVPVFVCKTPR